jgi:hypothetical protein
MRVAGFLPPRAGYHRLARVAKLVNAAPLKGATPSGFAGSSPAPGTFEDRTGLIPEKNSNTEVSKKL